MLRIRIGPDLLACYIISHTRTGTVKICVAVPDLMGSPGSGSGSRRAKMTLENRKNSKKLMDFKFLSVVYSLLRSEGFSCSLDFISGGLGISKLQF